MLQEKYSLIHSTGSRKNQVERKEKISPKGRRRSEEASKRSVSSKTETSCTLQVIAYDTYRLSIKEILQGMVMGTAFCALVSYSFFRSVLVFMIMLPAGICYPFFQRKALMEKRRQQLKTEFKEGALILAASITAGMSVENAMNGGLLELQMLYGEQGLICREFSYIVQQLRTNRTVEDCMMELGIRSGLEEIKNFAEVFAVAKRGGADLGGILRSTAGVIRDKIQVDEEILTLTASKRFEQKIMMGIPFFIILYIDLSTPGFFDSMYHTPIGIAVMSVCLGLYLLSWVLSKRILAIEV